MNLFVKNLTVIDVSYLCETRGIVGDSWILDVSLSGQLNEMSMVLDFGLVKKQIKQLIDDKVDHRLLVPTQNKSIYHSATHAGYSTVDVLRGDMGIHLHCPNEAYCLLDTDEVTISNVKAHLYQLLKENLPNNITGLELNLRHEDIDGAFYHYSHGLKKHDGNCQRIAHGHRSTIELIVDGQKDLQREMEFASRWSDIYLGSQEDLVSLDMLSLSDYSSQINEMSHYGFKYTAPQGNFELAIAKNETEVINSDTTIELLANYIADEVKAEIPNNKSLQVVAYEGVDKGAVAFR